MLLRLTVFCDDREAATQLQSQPRGLALSGEGTAFVSEINAIEAFRSNQRVAHVPLKYEADGIATTGEIVAVGGNVCPISRRSSGPND